MDLYPTKLSKLDSNQLEIVWSDGETRHYDCQELRRQCPCATCRKKHGSAASDTAPDAPSDANDVTLVTMKPVGNYAYSLEFSDSHSTGIYTFEYLRQLGTPVA